MAFKRVTRCYMDSWRKCFDYGGKATRREFWVFIFLTMAIFFISCILIVIFAMTIFPGDGGVGTLVFILVILKFYSYFLFVVFFIPMLSLGFRRMHDIGMSGWWFFFSVAFHFLWLSFVNEKMVNLVFSYFDVNHSYDVRMMIYLAVNLFSLLLISLLCCQPTKKI